MALGSAPAKGRLHLDDRRAGRPRRPRARSARSAASAATAARCRSRTWPRLPTRDRARRRRHRRRLDDGRLHARRTGARARRRCSTRAARRSLTLLDEQRPAGNNSFAWSAASLPDGRYRLVVTATRRRAKSVTKAADVIVDRTLTGLEASARAISPNGDGVNDAMTLVVHARAERPGSPRHRAGGRRRRDARSRGSSGLGPHTSTGTGPADGAPLADGQLHRRRHRHRRARRRPAPTADHDRHDAADADALDAAKLTFTLSEPATVTLLVNQQDADRASASAGHVHRPVSRAPVAQVSAEAQDARRQPRARSRQPGSEPRVVAALEPLQDVDEQLEPVAVDPARAGPGGCCRR